VAELGERFSFPGVVLAAVLGELDRLETHGEGGEGAAGVDLGELVMVADEDDLGAVSVGVVEETGQLAGADHGRFVDHDHPVVR